MVIRGHQSAIEGSSGRHQAAIRRPSGGHQAALRRPSGGHQAAIRRPSGGHQAALRRPSGGPQAALRRPSGGHQAALRRPSGAHQAAIRRPSGGNTLVAPCGSVASKVPPRPAHLLDGCHQRDHVRLREEEELACCDRLRPGASQGTPEGKQGHSNASGAHAAAASAR